MFARSEKIIDILKYKYDDNTIPDKQILLLVKNADNFLSKDFILEWIRINDKKIIALIVISLLSELKDYDYLEMDMKFKKYLFNKMIAYNNTYNPNNPYNVLVFTRYNNN